MPAVRKTTDQQVLKLPHVIVDSSAYLMSTLHS